MSWILASFFMFLSSVGLYLCLRKSTLEKVPLQLNNLAMFLLPMTIYAIIGITSGANFALTPYQFGILLCMSFFFSYLGNQFSLKSQELAPNPGYSLVITKSYVLLTTVVSIIAFGSEITLKSAIAIAMIVFFSSLIALAQKSTKNFSTDNKWLHLAIVSFFCLGFLSLTTKYLFTLGVQILPRLVYNMLLVNVLILLQIKKEKIPVRTLTRKQLLLLLAIGVFGTLFNYFMLVGLDTAPNIGYVNAINVASIAVVTILAARIFNDELTLQKMIGVFGVIGGLTLLVV